MEGEVFIEQDGKRYKFVEPGLQIHFGSDHYGHYVSFSLGGTLQIEPVSQKGD